MRKIRAPEIALFATLFFSTLGGSGLAATYATRPLGPSPWRPIALALATALLMVLSSGFLYRLCLRLFPLPTGPIADSSRAQFGYHLYLLFHLMVFNPLLLSSILPFPVVRLLYLLLGAHLGPETYPVGIIYEPHLVRVGTYTVIGRESLVIPHLMEGQRLELHPIVIGDYVTIGAHAIVMAGVTIGDHAVIAPGSVVPKGAQVGPGEVWVGVPARCAFRRRVPCHAPEAPVARARGGDEEAVDASARAGR